MVGTMSTTTPVLQRWDELPGQEVAPGVVRRYLTGSRVTVARFTIARGAIVPVHAHDHEQVSSVLRGTLRFTVGGRELVLRAGDVLDIPSRVEHGVEALEETDVLDVFSPVRQDWLDGTDTYFRR
jgi:unsaturated pyranuronate lyase